MKTAHATKNVTEPGTKSETQPKCVLQRRAKTVGMLLAGVVLLGVGLIPAKAAEAAGGGYNLEAGAGQLGMRRTVRVYPGTPQTVINDVGAAMSAVSAATGMVFEWGAPEAKGARNGEITVQVAGSSGCGTGASWTGCTWTPAGQNQILRADMIINSVYVGSNLQRGTVFHEFGHAIGLAHYDGTFNGQLQTMNSHITPDMTGYRAGDYNGLAALAPWGTNRNPFGGVEAINGGFGNITVSGWAADADTAGAITVHTYLDGQFVDAKTANGTRTDVANANPGFDSAKGYTTTMKATGGWHNVCVYGLNVGGGSVNTRLGCVGVNVSGNPIGSFDSTTVDASGVTINGWALDPDTSSSINVNVVLDGQTVKTVTANTNRGDIASVFPGYGPLHGYNAKVGAETGSHSVCVYAMNTGAGDANVQVGCKTVKVGGAVGSLDTVSAAAGGFMVSGWALKADYKTVATPTLYVDGVITGGLQTVSRGDVDRAFGSNPNSGYSGVIAASAGTHYVCVGTSVGIIGCKNVTVGGNPFGSFDVARKNGGNVHVEGWAIDPGTAGAGAVHVYVDSKGTALTAGGSRPDVGGVFPGYGSGHGFNADIPSVGGTHTVCAYAIATAPGASNVTLGCKTVTL